MRTDDLAPDRWLTLSEASALLGVHASTLRRWADGGRVACQRTPGGHRRFSLKWLQPLIQGNAYDAVPELDGTAHATQQPWYDDFERAGLVGELREVGQRLSGILMQFLMRRDEDERHLAEGHALGRAYAAQSRAVGIRLTDAVEAFLFFRSSFSELVTRMPVNDATAVHRTYARYDEFMSRVLIGLISGYQAEPNGQA